MKKLSKLLALLLALALVFSLAACGAGNGDIEETDADLIIGEWLCTFDFSDAMNEAMGLDGSIDMPDTAINVALTLEFTKTKVTMTMEIDEDSYQNYLEDVVDAFIEWALETNDMTLEDMDAVFEAEYGMSAKEYCEEVIKENMDSVADSMSTSTTSYYSIDADEGCIYVSEDEDDFDDADYMEYTLKSNTLTVKGVYDADGVEIWEDFESMGMGMPWKFERQ